MQTTCWTVSEYIFAQVMSSAIWFLCTAIGGFVFYKFRHRLAGVLRGVIEEATRRAPPDGDQSEEKGRPDLSRLKLPQGSGASIPAPPQPPFFQFGPCPLCSKDQGGAPHIHATNGK